MMRKSEGSILIIESIRSSLVVFFICVLFFFVLCGLCFFVLFVPLLYFFYAIMSIFFIFGRVVFFIDTVSMVVCATICVWLGYGYVTVAYWWLLVVFYFFALFCFWACRLFVCVIV